MKPKKSAAKNTPKNAPVSAPPDIDIKAKKATPKKKGQ